MCDPESSLFSYLCRLLNSRIVLRPAALRRRRGQKAAVAACARRSGFATPNKAIYSGDDDGASSLSDATEFASELSTRSSDISESVTKPLRRPKEEAAWTEGGGLRDKMAALPLLLETTHV